MYRDSSGSSYGLGEEDEGDQYADAAAEDEAETPVWDGSRPTPSNYPQRFQGTSHSASYNHGRTRDRQGDDVYRREAPREAFHTDAKVAGGLVASSSGQHGQGGSSRELAGSSRGHLSPSVYEGANNIRHDAASMSGDRATWYSEYAEGGGMEGSHGKSALNSATRDSFPQSMNGSQSYPSTDVYRPDSLIHPPNAPFARNSNATTYSAPSFRIGTPGTPERVNSSNSVPTSPYSPNSPPSGISRDLLASPHSRSLSINSGRSPSLTFSKNFSRPSMGGENEHFRSPSYDSTNDDRLSVSNSSTAGSVSGSWEGRQQFERRRQEALLSANQNGPSRDPSSRLLPPPTSPSYVQSSNMEIGPSNRSQSPSEKSYYASSQLSPLPVQPSQGGSGLVDGVSRNNSYASTTSRKSVTEVPKLRDKWSLFKPKSRSKLRKSEDFTREKPPLSPSALLPRSQSNNFPSLEKLGSTAEILTREEKRRSDMMVFKPSVGKSVMASYVQGGNEGLPAGWPGIPEEVEQLGEERRPKQLQAEDFGPQRLDRLLERKVGHESMTSMYSNLSLYSLPADDDFDSRSTPTLRSHSPIMHGGEPSRPGTPMSTMEKTKAGLGPIVRRKSGDPQIAEDFLQLGIDFHESGELERSAWNFEQSAKRNGGCGAGMLMYGLTLRHGWGVQVNAPLGFQYLQKAAESVVEDLDRVVSGGRLPDDDTGAKAVKNELVLALHELGTSYRFGWGVERDKKMAVGYFELAANLGDPDAQSELAFCYANGKGCKKDMKKAAKYYRMAVAQGAETFGLSWIYKPKYMDDS